MTTPSEPTPAPAALKVGLTELAEGLREAGSEDGAARIDSDIEKGALDPYGLMLEELAPGVLGYTVEHEGRTYVPMIEAVRQGSGDVGRFLDSLSPNHRIPNVVNARLVGMLLRRGWVVTHETTDWGELVDVWKPPAHNRETPPVPAPGGES